MNDKLDKLTILQRICWNTSDWRKPSASNIEADSPEAQGFGHEEWNFNIDDNYLGFVFPYTYSVPSDKKLSQVDGIVTIKCFSFHAMTKRWILVGALHNARLIEDDEYPAIIDHFENTGVFDRRARELGPILRKFEDLSAAKETVKKGFTNKWYRWKCAVDDVEYYNEPVFIEKPNNIRFTRFTYLTEDIRTKKLNSARPVEPVKLVEDSYLRATSAGLKEIIPRHNKLSNNFCDWLREHKSVPVQEDNFVDVIFEMNTSKCIAELKVVYGMSTRKAIREALGQLFEYNLYPGRQIREIWMIVLDQSPTEDDKRFIDSVNLHITDCSIYLSWEEAQKFTLYPESGHHFKSE